MSQNIDQALNILKEQIENLWAQDPVGARLRVENELARIFGDNLAGIFVTASTLCQAFKDLWSQGSDAAYAMVQDAINRVLDDIDSMGDVPATASTAAQNNLAGPGSAAAGPSTVQGGPSTDQGVPSTDDDASSVDCDAILASKKPQASCITCRRVFNYDSEHFAECDVGLVCFWGAARGHPCGHVVTERKHMVSHLSQHARDHPVRTVPEGNGIKAWYSCPWQTATGICGHENAHVERVHRHVKCHQRDANVASKLIGQGTLLPAPVANHLANATVPLKFDTIVQAVALATAPAPAQPVQSTQATSDEGNDEADGTPGDGDQEMHDASNDSNQSEGLFVKE